MKEVLREEETNSDKCRKLGFISGQHKLSVFVGLFFVLCLSGCDKTKVLNDVVMSQAFSLPLGEKEVNIDMPSLDASTTKPGPYGTFYYNGRPFPVTDLLFHNEARLDFSLDSMKRIDWVERLDFKIRVKNTFPCNAYFQVYILDANNSVTDSIFISGKQKAAAGEVNSLDEVKDTAVTVFETIFADERLVRLKKAKFLTYHMYLETKREDGKVLRFTNHSNFKINLAMRLFLKYNINEIEWVKF